MVRGKLSMRIVLNKKLREECQKNAEYIQRLQKERTQLCEEISTLKKDQDELFTLRIDNKNKAEYIEKLQNKLWYELFPENERLKATTKQLETDLTRMKNVFVAFRENEKTGSASFLSNFSFGDLLLIDKYFGIEVFLRYRSIVFEALTNILKKKKTIKVAFIYTISATWGLDSVYQEMKTNTRFQPIVVVLPPYGTEELEKGFCENWQDVKEKGYDCVAGYDVQSGKCRDDIIENIQADIIFWQVPYFGLYTSPWHVEQMKLSSLQVYVPYGFNMADLEREHYDLPAHRCMWRYYADHASAYRDAECVSHMHENEIRFSGLPKMDGIQKDLVNYTRKKKTCIIWAPHHSLPREDVSFCVATFDQNKDFFLDYARNHSEVEWILRPHPLLGDRCVKSGLYANTEEYNAYWAQWERLPNARLFFRGDMLPIYAESSAMILDSVGFMAEYMYYSKPMLRLIREGMADQLNSFGQQIVSTLQTAYGTDFKSIGAFIEGVSEGKIKSASEKQHEIFRNELDYLSANGMKASKYILKDIEAALSESKDGGDHETGR